MPALTSTMSAPASVWAMASAVTVDRSPPRSSSANVLRPVGLMRSPMMQKGCVGPIVTVLDRECRTVSMRLVPFGSGLDAQSLTELGDPGVLAERDEVKAADARQQAGVLGELAGDLEALGLLVGGGLGARDELRRDLDPGDLLVDELQRERASHDQDRRNQLAARGQARRGRLGQERLEALGHEADLQLQEARAGVDLLRPARDAVPERRRSGVLDGPDEEPRGRLEDAAREVAAGGERARHRDELGRVEVEDAARLGLVAGRDVVAGHAADVLDAVHRRADDLALEVQAVAVTARELHDGLDATVLERDRHGQGGGVGVRGGVVGGV